MNDSTALGATPLANVSSPSYNLWLPVAFTSSSSSPRSFTLPLPDFNISHDTLSLLLLFILPLLLIQRIRTQILTSPLTNLPGPKFAKYGPWFVVRLLSGNLAQSIARLHREHGPGSAVVIAPNIVSVSSPEDVRRVYGSHALRKDPRLGKATFGGVSNVFAELEPTAHTRLLRLTNPSFRPSSLSLTQPALTRALADFTARVENDTKMRGSADVWSLYRLLSFDMLAGACFGQELGAVKGGGEGGERHGVVEDLDAFMIETALRAVCPTWACWLLERAPVARVRFIMKADQRLADYGLAALRAHRTLYPDLKPSDDCGDMLGPLRLSLDPDTGEPLSDQAIAGNLATYILAGADTTPAALSFITHSLAQHPQIYQKLRRELEDTARERGMQEGESWEWEVLKTCTYLGAVVKEGLRRWPPTVMPMTRVVPDEGFVLSQSHPLGSQSSSAARESGEKDGREKEKVLLQPGTYVCATPWTLHFDPSVFPEPDKFEPERWIPKVDLAKEGGTEQEVREREEERRRLERMEASWMPFGVGVRRCQGRLLAEMELTLTLATVVSQFSLSLHPSTTADSMEEVEMVTLGPKAHRCEIVFERREMDLL